MKKSEHNAPFLPNGEVNRHMITGAAQAVMFPLVVAVGKVVSPPAPATVWLRHTVTALYNMGQAAEFADTLKLFYALAGLTALPDIEPLMRHPVTASHFMLSCLSVVEELTEGVKTACVD